MNKMTVSMMLYCWTVAGAVLAVDGGGMAGATVVSPLLFGHNLETTRRGVWQGLGAERVANRKFAADLKRWTVIGPGEKVSIDSTLGYAGGKSACIKVPAGGAPCGIAQAHDWLALKPGTKYNLRIWVKSGTDASSEICDTFKTYEYTH